MKQQKPTFRTIFSLVMAVFSCTVSMAQTSENVRSDRPGLSNSAFSVGKNQLQFQAGYQADFFQLIFTDANGNVSSDDYFDIQNTGLVVRYGITEWFEINAFSSYNLTSDLNFANSIGFSGLSLRGNLYSGDGLITAIGAQADFSYLNRDLGVTQFNAFNSGVRISGYAQLNETFGFTTNLGFTNSTVNNNLLPSTSNNQSFYYTLNLGAGLGNWSCFAEYLGSYSSEYASTIDVGGAYLLGNNLQFDLYGGLKGVGSGSNNPFVSAGITYRLNCNKQ